jgi:hypothetical protein
MVAEEEIGYNPNRMRSRRRLEELATQRIADTDTVLAAAKTTKTTTSTSYVENTNGTADGSTANSTASTLTPLYNGSDGDTLSYDATGKYGVDRSFTIQELDKTLSNNGLLSKTKQKQDGWYYNHFYRYGWVNPYDYDRATREFLFFTRPDLNIFKDVNTLNSSGLQDGVADNGFIADLANRNPWVLTQFQHIEDGSGINFMPLFTNMAASKLDMPGIDSESQEATPNVMGTTISYRGHSLKSDNGYDFTLSFYDTPQLEVYSALKAYDEYMRMLKLGNCEPKEEYIINHIIPEQFSIYKFIVGSDGETLLYYAKLTGCYFKDVPRSDAAEFSDDRLKYSVSMHAQFVEDMNPYILQEFNRVGISTTASNAARKNGYMPIHDEDFIVNNEWARFPTVLRASQSDPTYGKRVARRGLKYDYFLKWAE